MAFADDLEAAAKAALCGWLANGGNAMAATWIVNGAKTPATAIASAGAGLGLLAVNYACNYDPGTTEGDGSWTGSVCRDPGGVTYVRSSSAAAPGTPYYNVQIVRIGIYKDWPGWVGQDRNGIHFTRTTAAGAPNSDFISSIETNKQWVLTPGTGCLTSDTGGLPVGPLPPYTYTNQTTNCTYVVTHEAFVSREDGSVEPVLKIEPGPAQLATPMASGGVIGGCNFPPVVYVPGGPVVPWQPGPDGPDGEPWWWDIVKTAGGAVLGGLINRLIEKLLEEKAPAVTYRVVSVCETDAGGEAVSQAREVSIPELPVLDGLVARVDAMDDLMQALKDFKQPVCGRSKPGGDLVTVNFQSDPDEVPSRYAVKKHLSYRDLSGRGEDFHAQHWAGYSWETGGAIVTSKGLPWGVVQVWAADVAEGQRVIAHAASAAGVNLNDPKHEWEFSSTTHPRYGRQATVWPVTWDETGKLMISKRSGPGGLPSWKRHP